MKLNRRDQVAEGTLAFCFGKPFDFVFKAGQFLELMLAGPPPTDAATGGCFSHRQCEKFDNPAEPVVCLDERPVALHTEVRPHLPPS